jgi:hypothetical protein
MRTLLMALLLTLAFAGSAGAQEQVRTGSLRAAPAAAPRAGRPVPARVARQAKATTRSLIPGAKAALVARPAVGRAVTRRAKRPAPGS